VIFESKCSIFEKGSIQIWFRCWLTGQLGLILNLVSLHGSEFGLVDVISIELKVDVMLKYFWVLTKEHRGSEDQNEGEDDNSGIDLHDWGLFSIVGLKITGNEFEKHVGENCWVNKLDANTEVNLEGGHPNQSSIGCWSGQAGNAH